MVREEWFGKMRSGKPYFMENEEWYYFDEKDFKYKLTDKATNKAIESYNEWYKDKTYEDENGDFWMIQ